LIQRRLLPQVALPRLGKTGGMKAYGTCLVLYALRMSAV
jgi:hypothetical protein